MNIGTVVRHSHQPPARELTPITSEPAQASDEFLLAAFAASDPEATEAFVHRFQRAVFGVALTIVGSALADDVAQETFVRAWRHAGSFDPRKGTVRSWLVRIGHNLAVDALRAQRTTPYSPSDLTLLIDALTTPDPQRRNHDDATTEALRAALDDLPTCQSRAVVMAAVHGHTSQQIADIEGIPLGTAKARIRTGLQKLERSVQRAKPS